MPLQHRHVSSLQAPPVATSCPLNGLTVNALRLRSACLAVLKFSFQLPQAAASIDVDADDDDAVGPGGAPHDHGGGGQIVVDLESDGDGDELDRAHRTHDDAAASASATALALQDQPLFSNPSASTASSSSSAPAGHNPRRLQSSKEIQETQETQESQETQPASLTHAPQDPQASPSLAPVQRRQVPQQFLESQSQSQPQPQSQPSSQSQATAAAGRAHRFGRRQGRALPQSQSQVSLSQDEDSQALLQKKPHELVKLLLNERKKNNKLQSTKKDYLKQVKQLKRKCKRLEKEKDLGQALVQANSQFAIAKRGKQAEGRGSRFTLSSWFSIGIRKCLSQVAASDFGLTTMTDISGQTVMRCEKKTCGALVHTFRLFMAEALGYAANCRHGNGDGAAQAGVSEAEVVLHGLPTDQLEVEPKPVCCKIAPVVSTEHLRSTAGDDDDGRWSLISVGFMNDATNSNIWRRKKLNVCEVKVQWVSNSEALLEGNFAEAVSTKRCTLLGVDVEVV